MKGRTASLKFLQNKQFLQSKNAQLGELLSEMQCPEQEYNQPIYQPQPPKAQPPDSLSLLISKARQATNKKLKKSKKMQKRQPEQNEKGPFLTGVEQIEQQDKAQSPHQIQTKDMLDEQVINLLRKKTLEDELQLLKRQINATKGTLLSYEKQVLESKKEVNRLAGRYNSYFNLNLPVNKPSVDFSRYSIGMKSLKSIFTQKE